jgi:hypothetical protein
MKRLLAYIVYFTQEFIGYTKYKTGFYYRRTREFVYKCYVLAHLYSLRGILQFRHIFNKELQLVWYKIIDPETKKYYIFSGIKRYDDMKKTYYTETYMRVGETIALKNDGTSFFIWPLKYDIFPDYKMYWKDYNSVSIRIMEVD